MRPAAAVVVCTVLCLGSAQFNLSPANLLAQWTIPPRDPPAVDAGGSSRVIGRVVAADTGNALARARVHITSSALGAPRQITTDETGRYEARGLRAGRYKILVTRVGFVSLEYGQTRPFEPGKDLELLDGQTLEHVDFALSRGGVITGRITDHNGEPQAGIPMSAMRFSWRPNGTRQLEPMSTGLFDRILTDDLGQFRIYGLMPGSYVVAAGGFPGMLGGPDPTSQATSYFPGTTNIDEAQTVDVEMGREASAHFSLAPAKMARVSGTVVDSGGRPVGWRSVMLATRSESASAARSGATTRPDGTFDIPAIAPGNYTLEVFPVRMEPSDREFASFPISVDGHDLTDLVISTKPTATVSGRVVWEGRSPQPSATMRISPAASDPRLVPAAILSNSDGSGTVDAKGSFSIVGVHGNVLFRPSFSGQPPPWTLKAVRMAGADITDVGYDVVGDIEGLEVVMTDRGTRVSGVARDARNRPVLDYVVVVLPRDVKPNINPTRFTQTARPDQQGRYQMTDLPPGEYVAAAVEWLSRDGHHDPEFQKRIRSVATPFSLKEGQQLALDLALMP